MHSVEQAVAALLANANPVKETAWVDIDSSCGRVLASTTDSPVDVPPADNSAMDGYAIRHSDWLGSETTMMLCQRIPAGGATQPLAPGTAARIFTGGEIPEGADTVVMQENCKAAGDGVMILERPGKGANIRPRAQDIARGQTIMPAGRRLRPQDTGLLASVGVAEVEVFRPLRVAVISNGDELVEPGHALDPGRIYNSNRYLLNALLRCWGFDVVDLGIARDDPSEIRRLLDRACKEVDVIVSTGGVSVGEADHVRDVVEELGELQLWKVAIKPGKPFAFGHVSGTPLLGLPGNPASVLVTALIIARPYLLACQGCTETAVRPLAAFAAFERGESSRTEYLRVRAGPDGLECYPSQSSGILMSAVWGDGLAVQPRGRRISPGDRIDYLPYALLL